MLPDPSASLFLRAITCTLDASLDLALLMQFGGDQDVPVTLYVNARMLRHTGFAAEELVGHSPEVLLHPDVRALQFSRLLARMRQGKPTRDTVLGQNRKGWMLWVNINIQHIPETDLWLMFAKELRQQGTAGEKHSLEQLLAHAGSVLRILDMEGRCLYCSPSAEAVLGYSPADLQGTAFPVHVHPEDREILQQIQEDALRAGEKDLPPREYRIRTRDGQEKWVSSVARKVDLTEHQHEYHVTTLDITARKTAELQLQEQLERYRSLLDLTHQLETVTDLNDLIEDTLQFVLPLTEYEMGAFLQFQEEDLHLVHLQGSNPEDFDLMLQGLLQKVSVSDLQQRLNRARALFLSSLQDHPDLHLLGERYPTVALMPVALEGKLHGILMLAALEEVEVGEATRKLCRAVHERLRTHYSRVLDRDKLQHAREETLRAMGLVLEFRDYETKGHTDRVVGLSEKLGERLGLSEQDMEHLRLGAYLHDVGKVAIPDQVLLKPAKLTPEEWSFIQKHPGVGYELLQQIPTLSREVLEIVLYHQERWNGSGYPTGLSGEQIPLLARVFAVVDVYDALTSERPYKRAWSHEEALEQLKKESENLLDAQVVEAFVSLFGQP